MLFVDFEDGADVGVIQRGGGLGFTEEALTIFECVRPEELQRDNAAELGFFGFVATPIPPSPSLSRMR